MHARPACFGLFLLASAACNALMHQGSPSEWTIAGAMALIAGCNAISGVDDLRFADSGSAAIGAGGGGGAASATGATTSTSAGGAGGSGGTGAAGGAGVPPFVTRIRAGAQHTCAVWSDGTVSCWGRNNLGQLGIGSLDDETHATPEQVAGLVGVDDLALGYSHGCALLDDGSVSCWGGNGSGELGDGTTTSHPFPAPVSLGGAYATIASSADHTCGIDDGDDLRCWGKNTNGQIGNGTTANQYSPNKVVTQTKLEACGVGWFHTCARARGSVYCWGRNDYGQLGTGDTVEQTSPALIDSSASLSAFALGHLFSCAVEDVGVAFCWGSNTSGQLGNGMPGDQLTPTPILPPSGTVKSLAAGGYHACAAMSDGALWCWGLNSDGQLGIGASDAVAHLVPEAVAAIQNVIDVSLGEGHSCALLADRSARCWGDNQFGQLGDGTTSDKPSPAAVTF